jgi:LacI family transcriptional regulator
MAHNDRPATLRDVASAAGVHPATASRALNLGTRLLVSEETAQRVTEAAERLGYRPNSVARSLRTRRSHTIGVLIPDLNNPLFPPIIRGIEDRLAEHGYVALIGNTDADPARGRVRARHRDAEQPDPVRGGRGRAADGADEPDRAGLSVLLRLGR